MPKIRELCANDKQQIITLLNNNKSYNKIAKLVNSAKLPVQYIKYIKKYESIEQF